MLKGVGRRARGKGQESVTFGGREGPGGNEVFFIYLKSILTYRYRTELIVYFVKPQIANNGPKRKHI